MSPCKSGAIRTLTWIGLLAVFSVNLGAAQGPSEQSFEAASIRPVEWRIGCVSTLPAGGTQFAVTCRSLRALIAMAWRVTGDNIQGGDASALSATYDVRAVVPGNKPWTDFNTIRPMLRQLLIERFHLSVHTSSREEAGYGLFVAKNGAKLKPADHNIVMDGEKAGATSSNFITLTHVQGRGENMHSIATLFSFVLREPVADHTGLSGSYNIDLDFAPLNGTDSPLPSFFGAVEDTLGLRLKPERVSVPILVVDHVDANPTPN